MRRLLAVVSMVVLLLVPALPAAAAGAPLFASLDGPSEVPGPGDRDGRGIALIHLDSQAGEVCWFLFVRRIAPATAAHIHRGSPTVAGPVVVALSAPNAHGLAHGCTEASSDLIAEIRNNPVAFYVNVHNQDYPAGAVRGQL